MKIAESSLNGQKTLCVMEKMFVTSNFSFSHSVFKRLASQGCQKVSLCVNGLNCIFKALAEYLPFPKQQILNSSRQKQFADNNFRFDENGRKFSKRVENTVEKREIARYKQFLLFP